MKPGGAYVPAGFGEGSLWTTDVFVCDDTGGGACAAPARTPLKRLDPQTGAVTETILLEPFFANEPVMAFGAGSGWVTSGDYYPGPVEDEPPDGVVLRIDPETNRVVDRISVASPSGIAFGFGSVWVTSAGFGTLSRIDPTSGEVAEEIEVGRGAVDVAVDEDSGAVWVAGLYLPDDYGEGPPNVDPEDDKLSRVDPATNRVVAEIPIQAGDPEDELGGGAEDVAVGEGAVWVASVDGRLVEVDPATNEAVAVVPVGDYSRDVEVSGGAVWVTAQTSTPLRDLVKRVDPQTKEVTGSKNLGAVDSGGYGNIVVGGDHLWLVRSQGLRGEGVLARVSP